MEEKEIQARIEKGRSLIRTFTPLLRKPAGKVL